MKRNLLYCPCVLQQAEKKSLRDHIAVKERESQHLEAQVEALAANNDRDDTIAALRHRLDEVVASATAAAHEATERENSLCDELLKVKEREAVRVEAWAWVATGRLRFEFTEIQPEMMRQFKFGTASYGGLRACYVPY